MTGTSKMFSSTLTKCLDQLFQTEMMALNEFTMDMITNMAASGAICVPYMNINFTYGR